MASLIGSGRTNGRRDGRYRRSNVTGRCITGSRSCRRRCDYIRLHGRSFANRTSRSTCSGSGFRRTAAFSSARCHSSQRRGIRRRFGVSPGSIRRRSCAVGAVCLFSVRGRLQRVYRISIRAHGSGTYSRGISREIRVLLRSGARGGDPRTARILAREEWPVDGALPKGSERNMIAVTYDDDITRVKLS